MWSTCDPGITLLEQGIIEGENPVFDSEFAAYDHVQRVELLGTAALNGW